MGNLLQITSFKLDNTFEDQTSNLLMTFGNPYKGYHKSIHLEFILPTIYARVLNIWDIRGCILRNNKNKVIASVC